MKKKIVLFASGSGTNAENIIKYFKGSEDIEVVALFANRPDAYALTRAENHDVDTVVFTKEQFRNGEVLNRLDQHTPDLIVLAGFLWLMPLEIVQAYPNKIINIHPALLPDYGGKGMYGMKVHESVVANNEAFSGITIHYVNEIYDDGAPILQEKISLEEGETADSLAQKIHALEYEHFPRVIESLLRG